MNYSLNILNTKTILNLFLKGAQNNISLNKYTSMYNVYLKINKQNVDKIDCE